MKRLDVVVVGSVNADFVLTVDHRPAPGETVAASSCAILPGGKGANQAVAAARCGAHVGLVAKVGSDPLGDQRLAELRHEGIELTHTSAVDTPTGLAFVSVGPDGENTIVLSPGANAALGPSDVAAAAEALRSASVVVAQLEVPTAAIRRAFTEAAGAATVVLNAAPSRQLDPGLLALVDVLVVNQVEAEDLAGERTPAEDPAELARHLRRLGPSAVVITLGAGGAVTCDERGVERLQAPKVDVVDTTGAGDAFVGVLAARLSRSADLHEAVASGIAAGSATVAHVGAAPQVPPEVRTVGS